MSQMNSLRYRQADEENGWKSVGIDQFPRSADVLDPGPTGAEAVAFQVDGYGSRSITPKNYLAPSTEMTFADFVEQKFLPEHITLKRHPSRLYYQAILKHVITPEEVGRIFQMNSTDPRRRLKAIEGWPYLNEVRMCEVRHDHVSRVGSAAKLHGYSIETVRHIRNVIGTIFSHAIQTKCFFGENPVSLVAPMRRPCTQVQMLTPDKADMALAMMRYPERELTLIGAISGMGPAEVIGLQWGQINMMEEARDRKGIPIPPMTIAIRKCWYRGRLDDVKKSSRRDLAIDRRLLQVLLELRMRSLFTQPDDFLLVSQFGTPISYDNVMTQRLRPIARRLGVPSVSSKAFRLIQGDTKSALSSQPRFEIMLNQKPYWFGDRYPGARHRSERRELAG